MPLENIGELTDADEGLNHQIVDTFATISDSDRGWTEKIWASIARKDGSLQVDFGLGKYLNRDVMDGFGGVSRGREQWTVRASRALSPAMDDASVGPVRYEVVQPMKQVRFTLAPNDVQPIAYDILFEGEMQPFFEKRGRSRLHNRIRSDLIRYHQPGRVSGWVQVEGTRHAVDDGWFAFRDHSWGLRGVGDQPKDIRPEGGGAASFKLLWSPVLLTRPDGSKYEIQSFLVERGSWRYFSGYVNNPDGSQDEVLELNPKIEFDPENRIFRRAEFELKMAGGAVRHVTVEGLGETGFYLRAGQYGSWNGFKHGAWRGEYHEDGEYLPDCTKEMRRLGQLRDRPLAVREGDATGYGIQESIYDGVFPELGLGPESDFPSDL